MRAADGTELLAVWRQPVNGRLVAALTRGDALDLVRQTFPEAQVEADQVRRVPGVGARGEARWLGGSAE